jgi:hypothetical protein
MNSPRSGFHPFLTAFSKLRDSSSIFACSVKEVLDPKLGLWNAFVLHVNPTKRISAFFPMAHIFVVDAAEFSK